MLIQFFGLDPQTRNAVAELVAKKSNAFYCTDRELPMASLEAQFARWLRTIAGVCFRNEIKNVVVSGYFPTAESRQQFMEDNHFDEDTYTIWIDTIDPSKAIEPSGNGGTTDFKWESPSESEYNLRIINMNNDTAETIADQIHLELGGLLK